MRTPELWEQVRDLEKRVTKLEKNNKPTKGKWIFKPCNISIAAVSGIVECSVCGVRRSRHIGDDLYYCPHCGANMKGAKDE